MQRRNYKLQPNAGQAALAAEWLVTLRKHRNYCLRERETGWNTNNTDAQEPISYGIGAYCETKTRVEYGSCCPLACPVVKHGVMSATLTKTSKDKLVWDTAGGIQSKRTTRLRYENQYYGRIDSDVLQRNLAKLDAAFAGFWGHKRGFPAYRRASNFKSFEYKPGRCKFQSSKVYLPGLGWMRYFNSRPFPNGVDIRTVTIIQKCDGWYMSVLVNGLDRLPDSQSIEEVGSIVGLDAGINKLVALSDGSFIENPRFATNKRHQRRLRIRQRQVNRKVKGSKNRSASGKAVGRLHKKVADHREAYQWKAAVRITRTADAIAHEDLNIVAMKKRCKPQKIKGRFMPNGQSAKRSLNRAISDAAWGGLFDKITWLALKAAKPVKKVNPSNTSRECSKCGHTAKGNREGERFICESCGHTDHADTQAARTIAKRIGLVFPFEKTLPADCGKVTLVSTQTSSRPLGKRDEGKNSRANNSLDLSHKCQKKRYPDLFSGESASL